MVTMFYIPAQCFTNIFIVRQYTEEPNISELQFVWLQSIIFITRYNIVAYQTQPIALWIFYILMNWMRLVLNEKYNQTLHYKHI